MQQNVTRLLARSVSLGADAAVEELDVYDSKQMVLRQMYGARKIDLFQARPIGAI